MTENKTRAIVIESTIAIHQELGPGLFETVYALAPAKELHERGLDD